MMDAQAIQKIAEMAKATVTPKWIQHPYGGHQLVAPDGSIVQALVPQHEITVGSLDAFAEAVNHYAGDNTVVSVSHREVVATLDDLDGYGSSTINLSLSDERSWEAIQEADRWSPSSRVDGPLTLVDQKELDFNLRRLFPDDTVQPEFVSALRTIRWGSSLTQTSQTGPANASLGTDASQDIRTNISGAGEQFPEEVVLTTTGKKVIRMLSRPDLFDVRCLVWIDLDQKVFSLVPKVGEIPRVKAKIVGAVDQYLRALIDQSVKMISDKS